MEIRLAKTAGFCFGVNRAVELTYNLLNEGHKVATLGPLIHNPQAVADMERRGALVADTVDDIPTGYEVIIRSHGVPRTIYDTLEQRGLVYHDATCPFVKKIQSIAARAEAEGAVLLVAGDAAHPEVQGIVGHTRGEVGRLGHGVQGLPLREHKVVRLPEGCQHGQIQILQFQLAQLVHPGPVPLGAGHIRQIDDLIQPAHAGLARGVAGNGRKHSLILHAPLSAGQDGGADAVPHRGGTLFPSLGQFRVGPHDGAHLVLADLLG